MAVLLVVVLAVSLRGGSDEDAGQEAGENAGREAVCDLTAEFWGIVDSDEDRSEIDRLLEIAQQMGDGIDDEAEEEGFDDIAENATEAAISAVYAEATGDVDGVFDALENLESLCSDSGARD